MTRKGFWLGLGLLLSTALGCGSKSEAGGKLGGESHFLLRCETQSCGDELQCIGGLCTRECDEVEVDCDGLAGDLVCGAGSGPDGKFCDAECNGDADCAELGDDFTCVDGSCRIATEDVTCAEGGKTYELGESWQCSDGCNQCSCTEEGVQSTLIGCPAPCSDGETTYQVGDSWTCSDGCNVCSCTEQGVASTMMDCTGPVPEPGPCEDGGITHEVGSTWPCADGCNTCFCSEAGISSTDRFCPDGCEEGGESYVFGDTWQCSDGCNECTCTPDGVISTDMACSPSEMCEEGGNIYQLGDSWPCSDGCNECTCGTDGVGSTKRACLPGMECEEGGNTYQLGEMWSCSDGCNSCACTEDGVVSTDAACFPERVCVQGDREYAVGDVVPLLGDSCNFCTCGADGSFECTDTACDDVTEFAAWESCEDEACLCQALELCNPAAHTQSLPLGSDSVRTCSRSADTCFVRYFSEVEGGGVAYDCQIPRGTALCSDEFDGSALLEYCTEAFQCNLLGGEPPCPDAPAACGSTLDTEAGGDSG